MSVVGRPCPMCGTGIQRTITGTVLHGMLAHFRIVHPGIPVPPDAVPKEDR